MITSIYELPYLLSPHPMKRHDVSVTEFILAKHKLAAKRSIAPNAPDPDTASDKHIRQFLKGDYEELKKRNVPSFYASGFGSPEEPQTPPTAHRARARRDDVEQDILYAYVALDYDTDDPKEAETLYEFVMDNLTGYKIAFYPSMSYPFKPRFRLVVELDGFIDEYNYRRFAKALAEYIGVDTHDEGNFKTAQSFNLPAYIFPDVSKEVTYFNPEGEFFDFKEVLGISPRKPRTTKLTPATVTPNVAPYQKESLKEALKNMPEETKESLKDYDNFWRFVESIAYALLQKGITQEMAELILKEVAELAPDDRTQAEWESDNLDMLVTHLDRLENNSDIWPKVRSLNYYLPLSATALMEGEEIENLPQLLLRLTTGTDTSEAKPAELADVISQHFEFGLLGDAEDMMTDRDRLVVFSPLTGIWEHNMNSLQAMIIGLRPGATPNQVSTVINDLAARANINNKYIQPYSRSQHLVFTNGVWDLRNEELLPLSSNEVKNMQFTSRHALNIENPFGKEMPELKIFENDTRTGGPWSMQSFIDAYAHGGDPELRTYFLFLLSLGLFGGHNSGAHVNIQGPSGAGKTVLNNIWKGLYGDARVQELTFSDLNTDFPFNDYNTNAAIIWASECNEGVDPLDESSGVPLYDSLADGTAKIKLKHQGNYILRNAPQMFVDGTKFVQSDDLDSGPARRTLPYKLGDHATDKDGAHYSSNIEERLKDPDNLAWLVVQMIDAYQTVVPEFRQDDFKINLNKGDEELLPEQALEWRFELTSADANIQQFFEDFIEEYVVVYDDIDFDNVDHVLSDKFFYKLYERWYKLNNPADINARFMKGTKKFTEDLHAIFDQKGWHMVYHTQKDGDRFRYRVQITSPNRWGMRWGEFDETYNRPTELKDQTHWPDVYGKWQPGYFLTTEYPDKHQFKLYKDDPVWRRQAI